jgi:hypothetical protein
MYEPCVSCARLSKCKKVTPVMLEDGGGCSLHEESHEGVTRARIRAVYDFGAFVVCTKNPKRESLPMAISLKRYLRGIAIHLGLIPPRGGNSFKIPPSELIEMISGFTTDDGAQPYEDVGDKDADELKAILEDLKANGAPSGGSDGGEDEESEKKAPAKKPRRSRTKKTEEPEEPEEPADEEPADEDESGEDESGEDEELEKKAPPKKAPRKGTAAAKKAPVKKAPARRAPAKAKKTDTASDDAPTVDLSEVTGMVKTIGTMLDKHVETTDAKLAALEECQATILALLESLDGFFAWRYSSEVEPGNEVKSLTEIDWKA